MQTISGSIKKWSFEKYFSELTTATFSGVIVLPKCLTRKVGTILR